MGRAAGRQVDGVPVVWTRDRFGVPDRLRLVPAERHRRLRAYWNLDAGSLVDCHDAVSGVALRSTGDDETDLGLALLVDRETPSLRRSMPDRVAGMDVRCERRPAEPEPGRVCEDRILRLYDPVAGNVEVYGKHADGDAMPPGTLGFVGWAADGDGSRCLVTAGHVAAEDGRYADRLYQSGEADDRYREEAVGRHAAHSSAGDGGLDAARYDVPDGVNAEPLATVAEEQPTITGSWDFAGLADATADGDVPVSFAGRSTCFGEGRCVGTERNDLLGYAAEVRPAVATSGDSGGPFLDADGKLVALFSMFRPRTNTGSVGTELLDRVGVRLSRPGSSAGDG